MKRAAVFVVLGVLLTASERASAGDVFAGYSYLRSDDANLHGGIVSLSWGLSGPLSLVGEVAAHQATVSGEDTKSVSYLGGVRYSFGGASTRPFIHALAGGVRTSRGISVFGVDITESTTGFGGAAGAGIDFGVGERWAIRVQGDYRIAKAETETLKDPRASIGAVLRFGKR
jgi:hypothetical protein